ncbi:MAG: YcxB family protein [Clostridia bacterium]|nr:YcxB family protein [Clostridia bacterium]
MVTDRGTIRVETPVNADMQREFMKNIYIMSIVSLVAGSIGIAAYIAWDLTSTFVKIKEPHILILVAVAVFFAFGLVFLLTCRKTVKNTANGPVKAGIYEFFNNYLLAEDYMNGEKVGTAKIYYNQIIKRKETKSFLFFYVQTAAAIPVSKAGLSEGELNTLRKLFGLPVKSQTAVELTAGQEEGAVNENKEEQ